MRVLFNRFTYNRKTLERIHKLSEQCSNLSGFLIFHLLGGGTGSGFTSLLLESLTNEYSKKTKFNFSVYPSSVFPSSECEAYNAVLSGHKLLDHSDCCVSFGNEPLYRICENTLDVDHPNYYSLNQVISLPVSTITAPIRFDMEDKNSINNNIFDSYKDLFPFPRIHFPICSFSPYYSACRSCGVFSAKEITEFAFDPKNALINCDPLNAKYIACLINYCGDIVPRDVSNSISHIKTRRERDFRDVNLTIGMNYSHPRVIKGGDISNFQRCVSVVTNTSAITQVWDKINDNLYSLYQKRNFVNAYVNEGMEETEFKEARDDLAQLELDYKDAIKEICFEDYEEDDYFDCC